MLTQLSQSAYAKVAPLLTGLDHQLSVKAVLTGAMPGEVFVDDPGQPNGVFMHSPEGNFVGGDPADGHLVADLRDHLLATFVPVPRRAASGSTGSATGVPNRTNARTPSLRVDSGGGSPWRGDRQLELRCIVGDQVEIGIHTDP